MASTPKATCPPITISVTISSKNVGEVVDALLEEITDNFSKETIENSGIDINLIRNMIITDPAFLSNVKKEVEQQVKYVVEDPYEFACDVHVPMVDKAYKQVQTYYSKIESVEREKKRLADIAASEAKRIKAAETLLRKSGYKVSK